MKRCHIYKNTQNRFIKALIGSLERKENSARLKTVFMIVEWNFLSQWVEITQQNGMRNELCERKFTSKLPKLILIP